MPDFEPPPAWRKELAAERHLQPLVAGSVLVRGTAAALHAKLQQSIIARTSRRFSSAVSRAKGKACADESPPAIEQILYSIVSADGGRVPCGRRS
jgi:hypothetical protein